MRTYFCTTNSPSKKECQTAIKKLQIGLTKAPVLGYPSWEQLYQVTTDALEIGFGWVFKQADET